MPAGVVRFVRFGEVAMREADGAAGEVRWEEDGQSSERRFGAFFAT